MAHATEVASETVKNVGFSMMTHDDVKKLSVKKITNRNLLSTIGAPEPAGLYDPELGPMDDHVPCKTCGLRSFYCPGHCGHIDLVALVYHPLMFDMLYSILQSTCFFCLGFRGNGEEVRLCVAKLHMIRKGDIIGARRLETIKDISTKDISENSGCTLRSVEMCEKPLCADKGQWTSFQLTEAFAVLNGFLKKKHKKCKKCKATNPIITKPTFGWLYMNGLSAEQVKANIIRNCEFGTADEDSGKSSSEVVDTVNSSPDGKITPGSAVKKQNKIKQKKKTEDLLRKLSNQKDSRNLLPVEIKGILKQLWRNEADFCSFICDIRGHQPHRKEGYMMFFLESVLVPPTKFRPPAKGGDSVMEHPQTVLLGKVLDANLSLGNAYDRRSENAKDFVNKWMNLQQSVNILFDSNKTGSGPKENASGICQLLEKKEGMFRQKMMGKRVNYACRSVISPDPYLAVNEIGIPPVFALRLTYPERVTPWNVAELRNAIVNGPDIHPGATHYVEKLSTMKLQSSRKSRISAARKLPSSRGVVTQPGKTFNYEFEGKVVHRHLRNGDIVLVNRQPTLHKPSIIALKVRVLPGEKTIRFHYANCNSFNADFDGDEINVHFPQDEISRAEAYNIVNADNQYIVPTSGDPKRALIQDHIVSAVLLTKRDTFLSEEEFNQLLYASSIFSDGAPSFNAKSGKRVSVVPSQDIIQFYPPAIFRPRRLWTGKQVITAILNQIARGWFPLTVKKRAKIAREYFGKDPNKKEKEEINYSLDEDVVFIYKNELVQGVVDKEQFGKYGLVHIVQEMYGSTAAGNLLSVLSRVFTSFLQMHGFTCGMDDLLLVPSGNKERELKLKKCLESGKKVHHEFIGDKEESKGGKEDSKDYREESEDIAELQVKIEKAIRRYGDAAIARLDTLMKNEINRKSKEVSKLFPKELCKPFRKNCLSLMTLSGAKGGTFNFQQISLLLGQQELEGKRVPRMVSGKTLPCFPPWDSSARAGGFISDRFLTGLRPQEFYFHCMAGREGLVDTAVKTSRSGYLQRCLIKNLETLRVHYDYTVRDADGSIIQFRYGEDGIDIHQKNYLQEFEALAENEQLIVSRSPLSQTDTVSISKYIEEENDFPSELAKKARDFIKVRRPNNHQNFVDLVRNKCYMSLAQPGEPVGVIAGQSIGEPSTQMTLNTFHHAGSGEMNVTLGIPRLQEILMTASISIKTPTMTCPLRKSKSLEEAERLVAEAERLGENAERHAEIVGLHEAAEMEQHAKAVCLAAKLKKITLADLIEKMEVSIIPIAEIEKNRISSVYKLKIKLYDPELHPPNTNITIPECRKVLEKKFNMLMEDAIENHLQLLEKISGIKSEDQPKGLDESDGAGTMSKSLTNIDDDDDVDEDDDGETSEDVGSEYQRSKQQGKDKIDYEESSEGEVEEENAEAEEGGKGAMSEDESGDEYSEQDASGSLSHDLTDEEVMAAPRSKKKDREDRTIDIKFKGLQWQVRYKLKVNDPHMLLAQIAEKIAKKVLVRSAGSIEQCNPFDFELDCSETGGIPMLRKARGKRKALQTAGINFATFWNMEDDLDINYISSNCIHSMLQTYGVEAARATIITQIHTVFDHYGVSVDMRHLTLIADYMTHNGGYRPFSRSGIADSTSTFSKMSFETASKFLVEAARHQAIDDLETPSSRICLGLPAKVGTGCFDLMYDFDE